MTKQQTEDMRRLLADIGNYAHSSYEAQDEPALDFILKMSKEIHRFLEDQVKGPKQPPRAKLELVKD